MLYVLSAIAGVAVLILVAVIASIPATRRLKQRRRQHVASHEAMADEGYIAYLRLPEEHARAALHIRKAMAEALDLPTETLHPSDCIEYLCELSPAGYDDFDFMDLARCLERVSKAPVHKGTFGKAFADCKDARRMTFADFTGRLLQNWPDTLRHDESPT